VTGQQLKQELVAGPALAAGRRRCLDCHLAAPQRRLPLPRVLAGAGAHRTGGGVPSTDQLVSPSTRHPAGAQCSARSSSITVPSSRYPTTRSGLRGHARGRGIAIAAKPSRASATRPCIRGELGLPSTDCEPYCSRGTSVHGCGVAWPTYGVPGLSDPRPMFPRHLPARRRVAARQPGADGI